MTSPCVEFARDSKASCAGARERRGFVLTACGNRAGDEGWKAIASAGIAAVRAVSLFFLQSGRSGELWLFETGQFDGGTAWVARGGAETGLGRRLDGQR